MCKNYFQSLAVLVGYIIGVGMFGLPFLVNKSGLLVFFALVIGLGLLQHVLHLIYANTIITTKEYHRLPGYAGIYLGETGKKIATLSKLIGNYGALLAYIIITGIFLNELLSPILGGNEFIYATALFTVEAAIIYLGMGILARAELIMTIVLLVVVVMITAKGWPYVEAENFKLLDWRYALLPYGAVLFAVDGNGAIPMVVRMLKRNQRAVKSVIRWGTAISVSVIIAFTIVIVGVSGAGTSPDALTGIRGTFQNGMITFALIFGVLTMITSFLGVSESTREMLNWDYAVDKKTAWALAVLVPYGFYLLGMKNLIDVISFAGAVAGGLSAMILIIIFMRRSRQKDGLAIFRRRPSEILAFLFVLLFVGGIFYEITTFLARFKHLLF